MNISSNYSDTVNNKIISILKNIKVQYKITFIFTMIWGLFSHGMAIFNKYSFFDDAKSLFNSVGATYESGRWMLGILEKLESIIYSDRYYSLPLFYGVISILFIAFTVCLIVKLLKIKNILSCIALSGIMICFPTISCLFGYMFTSVYYTFGIFIAVLGGYFVCRYRRRYTYVIGIVLMTCSIGIYQANISVFISVILLYMIKDNYENEYSILDFIRKIVYYVFSIILSVILYFVINELFLWSLNISLSDYQGISSMGQESLMVYINRVFFAYYKFFFPNTYYKSDVLYSLNSIYIYRILLLFSVIFTFIILIKKFKENKLQGIELSALIIFLPLSFNFIYVISAPEIVYVLMMYSHTFFYVYIIWSVENIEFKIKKKYLIQTVSVLCIFILSFMYCKIANIYYLSAQLKQQRAISYFTTLVTSIKNTENYKDEYPVVFINANNKDDLSLSEIWQFDWITTSPYKMTMNDLINTYSWDYFVKNWTGYSPQLSKEKDFVDLPEVINMPSYPDSGSIKVINDTVVVKF